uniref:BHLH domain-containing protein n=1 Tax=Ascaris lumbricoides TaxID=6252 RepID=A0A0M3HFD5_ASCLU
METYNIMVDPRVCRGSVAANRRAQQERIRKEIHKKESEKRFRANVIRNRLSMGLSRYPLGGAEAHATKLSRISRLASMAGYEHLSKHKALLDDGIMKLLPDEIRSSELSRNTAIDKKWANSSGFGKKRTAFGNVRLVPMDTLTRAKYFATPDRSTAVRRAITTPPPTSAGICGRSDALVQTADVSDTKMLTFKSEVNRSSEEMIVRP